MKKLLFIYNPHAGTGRLAGKLSNVLDAFAGAGWLVTVWPTQGRGDATTAARELGPKFDRIVCSGGDGTLHEVIEGLMAVPAEKRPPIGYIPAGTTNDFARNLSLPRSMEKMAATAAAGVPRPVDIGRFNESYFIYVAAFGAFTDVSYNTPQGFKNTFGHLAYVLKGASELGNLKSYHLKVEHDDGELEGDFIYGMVSNTVSVGGVLGLPSDEVALDDGKLEAILVKVPKTPGELSAALLALSSQSYSPESGVIGLHSSRFLVSGEHPVPITLDGEYGGDHNRAEIAAVPRPVSIVYGK